MKLSRALRDERKRRGLSQAKLAAISSVPRFVVGLIETERLTRPFPVHVERLCAVLGLDPATLEPDGADV